MTCARCGLREAAVFMRRSGSGRTAEDASYGDLALCEPCARGRGIIATKGRLQIRIEDLVGSGDGSATCPSCGMGLETARDEGRLGCPDCVDAFYPALRRRFADPGRDEAPGPETAGRVEAILRKAAGPEVRAGGGASGSLFELPAFRHGEGPEGDVVLSTTARLSRCLAGIPFPGGGGGPAPSRELLGRAIARAPGWLLADMGGISRAERRALSERGFATRSYASDPDSLFAASDRLPAYVLVDEVDHLRAFCKLPGLEPAAVAAIARGVADEIAGASEPPLAYLRHDRAGWVCTRIEDCGPGLALYASLHLPALVMTGLQDRFFRSILREGVALRGQYSEDEASAGSVYEICLAASSRPGAAAMAAELASIAASASKAERSARAELATRGREALLDAAGRAFGIARHCRRLSASEGAALASTLRLAALAGILAPGGGSGAVGAPLDAALGRLLGGLGPGCLAVAAGIREPAAESDGSLRGAEGSGSPSGAEDIGRLRAKALRAALQGAELIEGGD